MSGGIEERFEAYCTPVVEALSHADRRRPAQWYLKGLMLPGDRKSVEPMAARVHPQNVRSAHQSMHHLVAEAEWSDRSVLGAVARQVMPQLLKKDRQCWWIVDDTAHLKKGKHSVGVARQYCGRVGKTDNCQVAVSLSLATTQGSLPLDYRLYLPQEWAEDRRRRDKAGVPGELRFGSKVQIAREEIQAALDAGVARGTVLADAWYGNEAQFRDWLCALHMPYVLGVRANTSVWWGTHQPLSRPAASSGRPRGRLRRDARHRPLSVLEVARALPPESWRTVSWRAGTKHALSSRFARLRVRAAQDNLARAEEWLLIEWPAGQTEPVHYWLSTLGQDISFRQLVFNAMGRWMIERDYEELKSELGLSHYEGRNWRGFHHHATLCIAAYGFLMLERLRGKKNAARFTAPSLPETFRPRGSASVAASQSLVGRDRTLQARPRHRSRTPAVPVLRETVR